MPISLSGSLNLSGSLTTTGTITATTLVVQTITSSISSITGSTNFGSLSSDTHKFTGSLLISGSNVLIGTPTSNGFRFKVSNNGAEEWALNPGDSTNVNNHVNYNRNTSAYIGANYLAATHSFLNGNVGIGTTTPLSTLEIQGSSISTGLIYGHSSDTNYGSYLLGSGQGFSGLAGNTKPDGTVSVGASGTRIDFGGNGMQVYTSAETTGTRTWAEKMKVTIAGNVGIGGVTANYTLDVNKSVAADFIARILNSSSTGGSIQLSGGVVFVGGASITNSGSTMNVIGTSTSLALSRFFVNVASSLSVPAARFDKYDANTTTSQVFIDFTQNNQNSGCGSITANGAAQATFTTWSDRRLKENITELPSQLQNILALNPCEFDYKDGSGHQTGFIAQEIQEIYPDAVGENAEGFLTVSGWNKTEAILVKAIQELTARVQYLENK